MITEGVRRGYAVLGQVFFEFQLFSQALSFFQEFCLPFFRRLDGFPGFDDCRQVIGWQKDDTVPVSCNDIVFADNPVSYAGPGQRIGGRPAVQFDRPCRYMSLREERQSDFMDLPRIPVQPPDDDSGQACSLYFAGNQVPDAGMIRTAAVIDDQYVSRLRIFQSFKKDIYASCMTDRTDPAGTMHIRFQGLQSTGCTAYGNSQTHTGIGQKRCA